MASQPMKFPFCLQHRYAPKSICFGCGPVNAAGLRIESQVWEGRESLVRAAFVPQSQHQAFPGVINGGIIGALLDCHSNWTAAWALFLKSEGQRIPGSEFPCTVTAEFAVKLKRPTPYQGLAHQDSRIPLFLEAKAVELLPDRAKIQSSLWVSRKATKEASCSSAEQFKTLGAWGEMVRDEDKLVTALCEGWFVAVGPGHPGYFRWESC